ncbi:hypothetical protein HOLleu_08165 [Holothuria leucospilota]|uniref:EF-hand domain-containing family member B n=1 Tax=Holothuria leucospilota TaxID=206669 RepID=A0A9Q1HG48_HOLLE|nr:hypothetical protein HOLleu_08165 [Holothuria leucospilota]
MSASTSSAIARRREELYGMTRLKNAEALKSHLTTDHIGMISKEGLQDDKPSWQSTFKMNFKGTQPLRQGNQFVVSEKQDTSHFDFRGDAAPIDDGIYLASLTAEDYQHKQIKPLPPVKPDGNVNLPDMNPRYWKDKSIGESLYATDFSDNKEVRLGVEVPDVVNERNDMRRRNVEDVRNTHFHFGNDPLNFNTETSLCYSGKKPLPAVGVGRKPDEDALTAAELTQKMIEQERDSAIFREGDYNVTYPKPQATTFSRDFDARAKPYKSAAFVEPTRTQKGRFLLDSPMKRYVEKEEALYPGPYAEEGTRLPDTITDSSALRHLFLQYDASRSGYVSKPLLRRVCDSLLHPIPPTDLETILQNCAKGRNGEIKYESFINQLFELQKSRHSDQKNNVNGEEMHKTEGSSDETTERLYYEPKESSSDEPTLGKEYQTSVHFKFGNDNDKLSTIYNKDFQNSQQQLNSEKNIVRPQPSEVMHKLPGVGFGDSTKQVDYINFKEVSPAVFQDSMAARDEASLKNKRRHEINNVVFAGDKEKEAADRQKSLSHASYIRHKSNRPRSLTAPPAKYNYIESDGALPYPSNVPQLSETNEAFTGGQNLAIESSDVLDAFKNENKERSKDGKRAHFHLGNDNLHHVSEAMDNFKTHAQVLIEAAGKKNQDDPRFPHHRVRVPNPTDPLHIKLRSRFMDVDTEKTGRLDKRTVKTISKEFQISISDYAMEKLLQRCESDFGDETVDYHKFVRSLTLEEVPNDVSAAHTNSVMMRDYRPLNQRR